VRDLAVRQFRIQLPRVTRESQSGDNRESLIQTAIANFVQRHPIKGGAVAIGVSGQSSFARFIKLPPVEDKKLPEIVRFEAIQQIPFPLDDVEWSYQLFRSPDSPDVEVGIFAMRKELIEQHIGYFTAPYEERARLGKPVIDRPARAVHVTLPNGVRRTAVHLGDQGCLTLPVGQATCSCCTVSREAERRSCTSSS